MDNFDQRNLISVSQNTETLINEILQKKDIYNIVVTNLSNGGKVLDFTHANLEGSINLARVCMADLARIGTMPVKGRINTKSGQYELEMIEVDTLDPVIACMASQYAGWNIKVKKVLENGEKKTYFKSMASGPARALARAEKELYDKIKYTDTHNIAILVLETAQQPDEGVVDKIAEKCKIKSENVYLLFAPTDSLAGSVQIAARIVETSLHKLLELGIDPSWIVSGTGVCPIAPVAENEFKAMGWTNDCIIFAGSVTLNVDVTSEQEPKLIELIKKCPSSTSTSYGKPFLQVFNDAGGDFFKIDTGMFAPAKITVINRITGNVFTEGDLNMDILDFS